MGGKAAVRVVVDWGVGVGVVDYGGSRGVLGGVMGGVVCHPLSAEVGRIGGGGVCHNSCRVHHIVCSGNNVARTGTGVRFPCQNPRPARERKSHFPPCGSIAVAIIIGAIRSIYICIITVLARFVAGDVDLVEEGAAWEGTLQLGLFVAFLGFSGGCVLGVGDGIVVRVVVCNDVYLVAIVIVIAISIVIVIIIVVIAVAGPSRAEVEHGASIDVCAVLSVEESGEKCIMGAATHNYQSFAIFLARN